MNLWAVPILYFNAELIRWTAAQLGITYRYDDDVKPASATTVLFQTGLRRVRHQLLLFD